MTHPASGPSGLVRITVASSLCRRDLAVPCAVPVVELLPELARCVGVLDRSAVYDGFRAVTLDGRVLQPDAGLSAQGIVHGDIVAICPRAADDPVWLHDDVAEAVALVVGGLPSWGPEAGRRTCLCAAAVLLVVGAPALLPCRGSTLAAAFAALVAALLVMAAFVLSRSRMTVAAVTAAYLGCLYATVAAFTACWHVPLDAAAVARASGGLTAAGVTAALVLARGRMLMLPAVVAGATVLATVGFASWAEVDAATLLACVLTLAVLTASGLPGTALSVTPTGRHARVVVDGRPEAAPASVDMASVSVDVILARRISTAFSATTGLLLVLLAPVAVSLGRVGCALPVLGCAVVMLRTRRCRAAIDVLLGITSGITCLVSTAGSVWWLYDGWRSGTGMVVASTGVAVLAAALWPRADGVRRGRLGDLAEGVALGALVPVLLLAVGLAAERP